MKIEDEVSFPGDKPSINVNLHEEFRDMLPRLIQLCHPDRNDNTPMSREVSTWLLHQKKTYSPK